MRGLVLGVVLMGTFFVVAPGAEAKTVYDEVPFTAIITDGQDHGDFLDIREIAVGEPGDGTLVFRFKPGGWTLTDATFSQHIFFTAKATAYRSPLNAAGGSGTSYQPFDKCIKDGTTAYCYHTYEKMKVKPGDKITATYAISYAGAAQDYGPGGLFVPDGVLAPKGKDYTITGGPAPKEETLVEAFALKARNATVSVLAGSAAKFELTLTNAGNGSANYTFAVAGLPEGYASEFSSSNGTLEALTEGTSDLTIAVPADAAAQSLNFTVAVVGPNGGNASVTLELVILAGGEGVGGDSTSAAGSDGAGSAVTAKGGEDTPGLMLPLVVLSLLGTAAAIRRRVNHDR